jgi:hypothetical protein
MGHIGTHIVDCAFISHSPFISESHISHRLPTHPLRPYDTHAQGLFSNRRRVCILRKDNAIKARASDGISRQKRHVPDDQPLRRRLLRVFREVAASILVCTAPAQVRATQSAQVFQDRGYQACSTRTCGDQKPEARDLLQSALARRRNLMRGEAYEELRACASSEKSVIGHGSGNNKENGQFWKEVKICYDIQYSHASWHPHLHYQ